MLLQLDRDGLDDLNVQVNWQRKGGTYWVRYVHVDLLGFDTAGKKTWETTVYCKVGKYVLHICKDQKPLDHYS